MYCSCERQARRRASAPAASTWAAGSETLLGALLLTAVTPLPQSSDILICIED